MDAAHNTRSAVTSMAICNDIGLCTLWTHERLHASSKQALYPDDAVRGNCTANRGMLLARGAAASRGALLKVRPFLPTVPPRRCGKRVPAPHRREETAREKLPNMPHGVRNQIRR